MSVIKPLSSGFVPDAELTQRYKVLTQLNYEVKNYPKAVDYGNKALQREPDRQSEGVFAQHERIGLVLARYMPRTKAKRRRNDLYCLCS